MEHAGEQVCRSAASHHSHDAQEGHRGHQRQVRAHAALQSQRAAHRARTSARSRLLGTHGLSQRRQLLSPQSARSCQDPGP